MKKILMSLLGATMFVSSAATADTAAFVGIAYVFGNNNVGITAKVISDDEKEKWVAAAGVTYYFGSAKPLGIDVSGGYTFDNGAILAGWDILQNNPQISAGWADIDDKSCPEGALWIDGKCVEPSDIRLKNDIQLLTTLENGINIYSFRYKSAPEKVYVGVMAQELLENPVWREAVIMQKNGFYAVNYSKLGLKMVTLEEWKNEGTASIHKSRNDALARL